MRRGRVKVNWGGYDHLQYTTHPQLNSLHYIWHPVFPPGTPQKCPPCMRQGCQPPSVEKQTSLSASPNGFRAQLAARHTVVCQQHGNNARKRNLNLARHRNVKAVCQYIVAVLFPFSVYRMFANTTCYVKGTVPYFLFPRMAESLPGLLCL